MEQEEQVGRVDDDHDLPRRDVNTIMYYLRSTLWWALILSLVGGGGVLTCSYILICVTPSLCCGIRVQNYQRPSNVDYENGQHGTGSAVRGAQSTHKNN